MKEILRKIAKYLKLDRRDMTVFLLSLLLAFSIWFLHNLSLKYTDFVSVQVTAKSGIDGRAELSSNSAEVVARARCVGFNLLGMKIHSRKNHTVEFMSDEFHHAEGETYYLTSKELQGYSHQLYGDGSVIEYFVTDTVWFKFAAVSHKRVPVVLNGSFEPADRFILAGGVKFSPDSVTLYGEQNKLDKVEEILTVKANKLGIDKDGNGVLKLTKVKGLRLSDDAVRYSYVASRYVDLECTGNVQIINKPFGKNIVIVPATVDAKFRCNFPFTKDPTTSAVFYVDYRDYLNSRSGKCQVKVRHNSPDVIECMLEPEYVELIAQ